MSFQLKQKPNLLKFETLGFTKCDYRRLASMQHAISAPQTGIVELETTKTKPRTPSDPARLVFELLRWCAYRPQPGPAECQQFLEGFEQLQFLRSREIDSLLYLASGTPTVAQRVYDAVLQRQIENLQCVVSKLEKAGMPVVIFKSGELLPAAFAPHAVGMSADVDILVPRTAIPEARRILFGMGFQQAEVRTDTGQLVDYDIAILAKVDLTHYEVGAFRSLAELNFSEEEMEFVKQLEGQPVFVLNNKATMVLEIDLHHGISKEINSEPLFARNVPSCHGVGRTFSPADHVWFNLTRLYTEVGQHGKQSFRPIAYTLPIITSGKVDWDVVSRMAVELSLGASLYYYLQLADWLAPNHVPSEVLYSLHPARSNRLRDWGWQLSRLMGTVDPFPFTQAI
jgi:Uncharacterised nucleotidyltransferase